MQPLIEELLSAGYHCQLRHVEEETSWEDVTKHGYVAIFDGDRQLAKRDGFQHNRKLRAGGALDTEALKELVKEATDAATEKKPAAASA